MTTSVVFLDPRVPDLAHLMDGLVPGTKGYVLNAGGDGVREAAAIIARDGLSELADISFVAHGTPGAVTVGATHLDTPALAERGLALAAIGGALAPGGGVKLYACNLAAGANGRRFLVELSRALGSAAVAAATHPVGAAGPGGSWELDAFVGTLPSAPPFTADARHAYQGVLTAKFFKGTDPIGDTGLYDARMVFGDFDGDGDVDIPCQNGNLAGTGIGYKSNNGDGTFADYANAAAAGTPFTGFDFTGRQITRTAVFVVDLDNDGDADIVDRTNDSLQYWVQGGTVAGIGGAPPKLSVSSPADNATGASTTASIV